jgi:hypothetical protein
MRYALSAAPNSGIQVADASTWRVEDFGHAGVNRICITMRARITIFAAVVWIFITHAAVWIFITHVSTRETYRLGFVRGEDRDSGRVKQPTHFGILRMLDRRGVEMLCRYARHQLCIAVRC